VRYVSGPLFSTAKRLQDSAQEPVGFEGGFGPKGLGKPVSARRVRPEGPWEGDFGPKGLGNLAQALAWVGVIFTASPVRAPDNAGAIHIDRPKFR
jgi:hypothetical protein